MWKNSSYSSRARWNSPAVKCLGLGALIARAQVLSLVSELGSWKPHRTATTTKVSSKKPLSHVSESCFSQIKENKRKKMGSRGKKEDTIEQTEIILFDVIGLRIKFKGNTFSYHKMCYYALSGNGLKPLRIQPKSVSYGFIPYSLGDMDSWGRFEEREYSAQNLKKKKKRRERERLEVCVWRGPRGENATGSVRKSFYFS